MAASLTRDIKCQVVKLSLDSAAEIAEETSGGANQPFLRTHGRRSDSIFCRSFTLDVVIFAANRFSTSETYKKFKQARVCEVALTSKDELKNKYVGHIAKTHIAADRHVACAIR